MPNPAQPWLPADGDILAWSGTRGVWTAEALGTSPSGGGGANPNAVTVTPSGGDDTAQIISKINSAISASITRGDFYAEVWFAGLCKVTSPPSSGSSGKCNAQIPLDPILVANNKVTLALRGYPPASTAIPHWQQTVPQLNGSVIQSTISPSISIGNEPSVIGGPTPTNGYGNVASLFSNMLIVIDGLSLLLPNNPSVSGFDFRGIAGAIVRTSSVQVSYSGTGGPGTESLLISADAECRGHRDSCDPLLRRSA